VYYDIQAESSGWLFNSSSHHLQRAGRIVSRLHYEPHMFVCLLAGLRKTTQPIFRKFVRKVGTWATEESIRF